MVKRVFEIVLRELTLDVYPVTLRVGLSACSVANGASALNHKAFDNAVEGKPVVKALVYELFEILNGYRRYVGVELNGYFTLVLNVYYNGIWK